MWVDYECHIRIHIAIIWNFVSTDIWIHSYIWIHMMAVRTTFQWTFEFILTYELILGTIGHIPHARGGCLFLCHHHFFYLPMPARKFLISWHITIFAVHGFCGDLVFLCSYPTVGCANFLFFTFTQKVFVHVTNFYFILKHVTC